MNTLLLTRSEIEHLVDTPTLDALLRDAFRNYSLERAIPGNRYFSELAAPGAMMILAPGLATGIPAYSVKVHAKYPAEQPGIRGALLLNDLQTGCPYQKTLSGCPKVQLLLACSIMRRAGTRDGDHQREESR